jgi:hypothetical protein
MQGSGIDVNGVLAEITRLNICASIISSVVLHFTRGSSIQQSDVRGWAKDLFLLKAVKTALGARLVTTTQLAEPIIVVRTAAVNLAAADAEVAFSLPFSFYCIITANSQISQSQVDRGEEATGPLAVNKVPTGSENFGTNVHAYVQEMIFRGAHDGHESDRQLMASAFGSTVHGILYPASANAARDLPVLMTCTPGNPAEPLIAPAGTLTKAATFVRLMNRHSLVPLNRIIWDAHRRKLAATGGDPVHPCPGWGTAMANTLRQLVPLISGDWSDRVLNSLVDVVLESQLNTLADEALGRLSQALEQILKDLMAEAFRKQRAEAEHLQAQQPTRNSFARARRSFRTPANAWLRTGIGFLPLRSTTRPMTLSTWYYCQRVLLAR